MTAAAQLESLGRDFEFESENCVMEYYTTVPKGGLINKEGEIVELQKGFKAVQLRVYTADFLIFKKNGGVMLIETKGYFKPKDRKKHQILKKLYPQIDLRLIFQSDGKVSHKTRYSQWAEKHGYKFHVMSAGDKKINQVIPLDWLEE